MNIKLHKIGQIVTHPWANTPLFLVDQHPYYSNETIYTYGFLSAMREGRFNLLTDIFV